MCSDCFLNCYSNKRNYYMVYHYCKNRFWRHKWNIMNLRSSSLNYFPTALISQLQLSNSSIKQYNLTKDIQPSKLSHTANASKEITIQQHFLYVGQKSEVKLFLGTNIIIFELLIIMNQSYLWVTLVLKTSMSWCLCITSLSEKLQLFFVGSSTRSLRNNSTMQTFSCILSTTLQLLNCF